MQPFDHVEVAQEAARSLLSGNQDKAAKFLRKIGGEFGASAFANDLTAEREEFAEILGLSAHQVDWMAACVRGGLTDQQLRHSKGMPKECRELLDTFLRTARETESDASAEANLAYAVGMIGYAASRGDITPAEHSNEFTMIKLVREQRANARRAKQCA